MEKKMERKDLAEELKKVLATAFSLYLKTHNYHWNVTGPNFIQYHEYLGDLYEEIHASVDNYAEHIRILGFFTPGSLKRFAEMTSIEDEMVIPSPENMFTRLANDNMTFIGMLKNVRNMADEINEYGVVNFLEGQIDAHEKIQWMLTSFTVKS